MKAALRIVKEKWLKYLLESIVIILSIISAFMLDNWHSQKQEYKKETLILTDISEALSFDLQDLKGNMEGHDAGVRSAEIIIAFLNDSIDYHDSLDIHFGNTVQEFGFYTETSAYDSYKENGTDIIKSRDLRKALAKLYEFDYRSLQNLEETAGHEFLDPNSLQYHSKKFNISTRLNDANNFELTPRSVIQLKNDEEYKFYVVYQHVMRRYIYERYKTIEKHMIEVRAMIEAELETH